MYLSSAKWWAFYVSIHSLLYICVMHVHCPIIVTPHERYAFSDHQFVKTIDKESVTAPCYWHFVMGIDRSPGDVLHKGSVMQKTFPWWRHQMWTFSALLAICAGNSPVPGEFPRGIHRSPVNFPHKGQWRGALMFSLICVWINGWVNNRETGELRRYRAHYDVTIMPCDDAAIQQYLQQSIARVIFN